MLSTIIVETVTGLLVLTAVVAVVAFLVFVAPYMFAILFILLIARYIGKVIVAKVEEWGDLTEDDHA